ncbi:MAG: transcriptional regulator [Phycisphaeraceae bacterium]|nr:transcriptional regulator [Phycisphaeraceae bacterium]
MRTDADLPQRGLGAKLDKPQSWVHNCETGSRRVDICEFIEWARACDVEPVQALRRLLKDMG